jgi:hypothetical protein
MGYLVVRPGEPPDRAPPLARVSGSADDRVHLIARHVEAHRDIIRPLFAGGGDQCWRYGSGGHGVHGSTGRRGDHLERFEAPPKLCLLKPGLSEFVTEAADARPLPPHSAPPADTDHVTGQISRPPADLPGNGSDV